MKQISKMVMGFMGRILMTFFVIAIVIEIGITQAKVSQPNAMMLVTVATFGIMFPFVRGAGKVFKEILRIGIERLAQRKYADAEFVLEYFHRFGQMSFDPTGKAHYHLVRALLGLGNVDRARMMVAWMQKHRRRNDWTPKAAEALAVAERKLEKQQAVNDLAAEGKPASAG